MIPVFTIQSAIVRRSAVENCLGDISASKRGSRLLKELSRSDIQPLLQASQTVPRLWELPLALRSESNVPIALRCAPRTVLFSEPPT